jgi:hypothetical protein
VARSTPDDIAVAQLTGRASYCVTHKLERDAAVTSLRAISARPDLLAKAAGRVAGGWRIGSPQWPHARAAARLLIAAGADWDLLGRWVGDTISNASAGRGRMGAPETRITPTPDMIGVYVRDLLAED